MPPADEQCPYTTAIMARPTTKRGTDFGQRLAGARKAAGLTQVQLADKLGVSQQMIDYYERRARNPSADFVRRAAAVLNVSSDTLLGTSLKAERKPGPPSQVEQLGKRLSALPRAQQKLVIKMLEGALQKTG